MSKLTILRQSRFLALFVSLAVVLCPLSFTTRSTASGVEKSFPFSTVLPRPAFEKSFPFLAASLGSAPQQASSEKLYSSYWYLDRDTTAMLEITNNGAESEAVTPTLLVRGTEHLSLDTVTVPSHATRRISLNNALKKRLRSEAGSGGDPGWGNGSKRGSLWGSATLQAESVEHISSKILSENPTGSLAVHSGFYEYGARALSSMWWLPTKNSSVLMALQNATYRETFVRTLLYLDGRLVSGPRLRLPAGGSGLFDLRDLVPKSVSRKLPSVGAVRFIAEDDAASLLGRAVLFDEQQGFSAPLKMHSIFVHITNTLQFAGAPFGRPDKKMGFPRSTKFTTQLLLTNASQKAIDVTVTLDGRNSEGEPISSSLPVVEIPALQSRAVDLDELRLNSHSPITDGFAGVRLTHTGSGPELLAEAITVDRTLTFSFDNAVYDNDSLAAIYNAISFNMTGNKDTFLLIKNPLNVTSKFGYRLNYEKQSVMHSYRSKLSELKPYELRVVDLRAIRDSRVPGEDGQFLPADVEFGNANIYSNQPIISGDPNFDPAAGISSSCISPCGIGYEGPERCPFSACPGCTPCELHPEFCEGGGGPPCANGCAACIVQRNAQTGTCQVVFATAEAAAFGAYLAQLNACENNGFCREDEPTSDPEECDRCKNTALEIYLVAVGAAAGIFALCLNNRRDCSVETREIPVAPFCIPCVNP